MRDYRIAPWCPHSSLHTCMTSLHTDISLTSPTTTSTNYWLHYTLLGTLIIFQRTPPPSLPSPCNQHSSTSSVHWQLHFQFSSAFCFVSSLTVTHGSLSSTHACPLRAAYCPLAPWQGGSKTRHLASESVLFPLSLGIQNQPMWVLATPFTPKSTKHMVCTCALHSAGTLGSRGPHSLCGTCQLRVSLIVICTCECERSNYPPFAWFVQARSLPDGELFVCIY